MGLKNRSGLLKTRLLVVSEPALKLSIRPPAFGQGLESFEAFSKLHLR